jgi:hypothetical protein
MVFMALFPLSGGGLRAGSLSMVLELFATTRRNSKRGCGRGYWHTPATDAIKTYKISFCWFCSQWNRTFPRLDSGSRLGPAGLSLPICISRGEQNLLVSVWHESSRSWPTRHGIQSEEHHGTRASPIPLGPSEFSWFDNCSAMTFTAMVSLLEYFPATQ